MGRWLVWLWALCGVALLASPARAQVNAENLAAQAREDGLGFALSLGASLAAGNVDLLDVRGEAALQYLTSFEQAPNDQPWMKDRVILSVRGSYRTFGGTPVLDERLAHLRYTRMIVPRVGVDVFFQAQNDLALRLDWRLVGGAGVRIAMVNVARLGLWGGTGYMAEYEIRNVPVDGPDPVTQLNHRWTTYLSWRAVLVAERLTWLNTAYAQPRFDDPADVQVVDETSLEAQVSKVFAFSTGLRFRYDSRAPAGLVPWDVRWTSGLTVRWAVRPSAPPPA